MHDKCKTCANGYPSISCVDCNTNFRNYRESKPQTNADHIRNMTDEELATLLSTARYSVDYEDDDYDPAFLNWLRQPKED